MPMDSLRNIQEGSLKIELTKPEYWEDLKRIRLEAIENEPIALGITKDRKEEELRKSEEDWKKELTDHDNFTVLVKGNSMPAGMAQAVLKNKERGWWGIKGVYLNKDFRRSGSGEKMIVFILNEIKKRGGKRVYLNVVV